MAAKKVGIGKKPTANKTSNVDDWVGQRSLNSDAKSVSKIPEPAPQPKTKMKRLTIDVSEPLHRAIKMAAVEAGTPMADMLRSLLEKNYQ